MKKSERVAIVPGQIYSGAATRYVFPPDASAWWHQHGSYAIRVVTVGRIWFEYESFLIDKKGVRTPTWPRILKRAKLAEFLKEIESGAMNLQPPDAPGITLDTAD